jgi:sialic acid synthase SpsE
MASIFSTEGLKVSKEIGQRRYKFASREAFARHSKEDYDVLLNKVLEQNRITYISDDTMLPYPHAKMLYCIPCYPTYPGDLVMPKSFPKLGYYGYSTHVHGIEDALLAITRGARLIEKHVTLDKTETSIKDNHFALSFEEFGEMVRIGRRLEKLTKHCNSIG